MRMKGKPIRKAAIPLLILLIIICLLPIPVTIQREVKIHGTLFDVSKQLTDIENWPNWYPRAAMVGLPIVISANPAGLTYRQSDGYQEVLQSLTAVPDTSADQTRVYWIRQAPLRKWILSKIGPDYMQTGLDSLKSFLENPATLYGFPIAIVPVSDTLILTCQLRVLRPTKDSSLRVLSENLHSFCREEKIPLKADYEYISFPGGNKDSMDIAVGMPVEKTSAAKKNMQVLKLPANGRLLTGSFTGSYARMKGLRAAMNKYLNDHHLSMVAEPMEKYKLYPPMDIQYYELIFPIY